MKDTEALNKNSSSIACKWLFIGFTFTLLFPSLSLFNKIGYSYACIYIGVAAIGLFFTFQNIIPSILPRLNEKSALLFVIITLLILFLMFVFIYPKIDKTGMVLGGIHFGGADTDNGLYNAVSELVQGRHPYRVKTFRGNPPSQMPGDIILAIPFYLIGQPSYQNFFWLVCFLLAASYFLKSTSKVSILFCVILIFCPVIIYHLLAGMTYMSISFYVALFMYLTVIYFPKVDVAIWKKILFTIMFGVSISSRPNFIFLLPLVFSFLFQNYGLNIALKTVSLAFISFVLVTLPFYLADPDLFSPLGTNVYDLIEFDSLPPIVSRIICPFIFACFSLVIALLNSNRDIWGLMRNATILQALIIMYGVITVSLSQNKLNIMYTHYGMLFLFFGIFGFGIPLLGKTVQEKN